jgi:alkylation response protein AidB-like acyl-CoA dehydrogenase
MDFEFTEEQLMFQTMMRDFVAKEVVPVAARWEEEERFPWKVWREMAEMGICGVSMPKEYGGGGGGEISLDIATEEIARGSVGLSTAYLVSCGISMDPIIKHAVEGKKREYVQRLIKGDIAYFALTEASGGSDAAIMESRYTKEGDCYVINGTKTFITNGEESEFGTVYANGNPSLGYRGISGFMIEKGTPGFSVGKKERKTGQHCSSTTELIFDNAKVPAENMLIPEGSGFRMALGAVDASRTSVAAQALGVAEAAYDAAISYSLERKAFGTELARKQAIQWMIADMAVDIEAARLLTYHAAWLIDTGKPFDKEAAIAKLFSSEASHRVCHKAVQIYGGYGYTRDFAIERYARDQRVIEIYEGTSEMQRWTIARRVLGVK